MKLSLAVLFCFLAVLFAGKTAHAQAIPGEELSCPAGTHPVNPSGYFSNLDIATGLMRQHACVDVNGRLTLQNEFCIGAACGTGGGIPFVGPNPWYDITGVDPTAGSQQSTTANCNGTTHVTLTAAQDFQNGSGILLDQCGPATTASTATAFAAAPVGTAGSTTYAYTVRTCDSLAGCTAASSSFQTTTGNATLTKANYNLLTWTGGTWTGGIAGGAPTNELFYIICRASTLIGMTVNNYYEDHGQTGWTPPFWVPACGAAARHEWLDTTVATGGGTTNITVVTAASSTISGVSALHSADAAILSAQNSALTTISGAPVVLPPGGTYNIFTVNWGQVQSLGTCTVNKNTSTWLTFNFRGTASVYMPIQSACGGLRFKFDENTHAPNFLPFQNAPAGLVVDNGVGPVITFDQGSSGTDIIGFGMKRSNGDAGIELLNGGGQFTITNGAIQTGGDALFIGTANGVGGGTQPNFRSRIYGGVYLTTNNGDGEWAIEMDSGLIDVDNITLDGSGVHSWCGFATSNWANILSEALFDLGFFNIDTSGSAVYCPGTSGAAVLNTFRHIELADNRGSGGTNLVTITGNNAIPFQDMTVENSRGWSGAVVGGSQTVANCQFVVGNATSDQQTGCGQAISIKKGTLNVVGQGSINFFDRTTGNTTTFTNPTNVWTANRTVTMPDGNTVLPQPFTSSPRVVPTGLSPTTGIFSTGVLQQCTNVQTVTTYTVQSSDFACIINQSNAAAMTDTVPDAGSTGFLNHFDFTLCNFNTLDGGSMTVNRTTSSTFSILGQAFANPVTTFTLLAGECAYTWSPDNANWDVLLSGAAIVSPGVFTNTRQNENFLYSLNGCNPSTVWGLGGAPSYFLTDAVSGCIKLPTGETNGFSNAVAGYAQVSDSGSTGAFGFAAGVGLFGDCFVNVNNGQCWGSNVVVNDGNSQSGNFMQGQEIDVGIHSTATQAYGLSIYPYFSVQPTGIAAAVRLSGTKATFTWTDGLLCDVNSVTASGTHGCVTMGQQAAGVSQVSQRLIANASDHAGAIYENLYLHNGHMLFLQGYPVVLNSPTGSGASDEGIGIALTSTAALSAHQLVKPDTSNADSVVVCTTADTTACIGFVVYNDPGATPSSCSAGTTYCGIVAAPGMLVKGILGTGTCAIGNFVIVDTTTNGDIKCTASLPAQGSWKGVAMTAQSTVGQTVDVLTKFQ